MAGERAGMPGGETGDESARPGPLLLIDTCGERASLAVCVGDEVVRERWLGERAASSELLGAVRELLAELGYAVAELGGVGVVNGPGSFTGVRVGLAMAKGLCEALGVPMAPVSRLELLLRAAEAGGGAGGERCVAVLRAGRGQVYLRDGWEGAERLAEIGEAIEMAAGRPVVYAEPELGELLSGLPGARFVEISARWALVPVRESLRAGGDQVVLGDANYVRNEGEIYARQRTPMRPVE